MFGKKRIVIINQSQSKIGIDRVENLNVQQIGGTINNNVKAEDNQEKIEKKRGGNYAIGIQNLDSLFDD